MDAMDLYPAGLLPCCHPAAGPPPVAAAPAPVPPLAAVVAAVAPSPAEEEEAALSSDDVDFLERILRDCHLDDRQAAPQAVAPPQVAAASQAAGTLAEGSEAAAVGPWADELVRRLLGCTSPEEARGRCAELLAAFRRDGIAAEATAAAAGPTAERLEQLRKTNGVLLRGLRSLHRRYREADAQRQRAEDACARMAAELAHCQEALRASERAKDNLQYHLQLMSSAPGITVGGM